MKTAKWIFYYTTNHDRTNLYVVGEKECIQPERTKIYKSLLKKMGNENVTGIGYTRDEFDKDFLVYPKKS